MGYLRVLWPFWLGICSTLERMVLRAYILVCLAGVGWAGSGLASGNCANGMCGSGANSTPTPYQDPAVLTAPARAGFENASKTHDSTEAAKTAAENSLSNSTTFSPLRSRVKTHEKTSGFFAVTAINIEHARSSLDHASILMDPDLWILIENLTGVFEIEIASTVFGPR